MASAAIGSAAAARLSSYQSKNNAFGPKPEGPKERSGLRVPSVRPYVGEGWQGEGRVRPGVNYGRNPESRGPRNVKPAKEYGALQNKRTRA